MPRASDPMASDPMDHLTQCLALWWCPVRLPQHLQWCVRAPLGRRCLDGLSPTDLHLPAQLRVLTGPPRPQVRHSDLPWEGGAL